MHFKNISYINQLWWKRFKILLLSHFDFLPFIAPMIVEKRFFFPIWGPLFSNVTEDSLFSMTISKNFQENLFLPLYFNLYLNAITGKNQ